MKNIWLAIIILILSFGIFRCSKQNNVDNLIYIGKTEDFNIHLYCYLEKNASLRSNVYFQIFYGTYDNCMCEGDESIDECLYRTAEIYIVYRDPSPISQDESYLNIYNSPSEDPDRIVLKEIDDFCFKNYPIIDDGNILTSFGYLLPKSLIKAEKGKLIIGIKSLEINETITINYHKSLVRVYFE